MTVYITIFFVILACSVFSLQRGFTEKEVGFVIFVLIAAVVGLRYASTDYFSYKEIYDSVTDPSMLTIVGYPIGVASVVEPGFAVLILAEKSVVGSFYFFIFAFGLLSVFTKFYAFKELSPFVVLTTLLYLSDTYFLKDLGQIRNAMASGLVLVSIIFVHQQQPLRFLVAIALAASIQAVALVALPLYFIRHFGHPVVLSVALAVSVLIAVMGGVGMLIPEVAIQLGFDDASRIIRYAASTYVEGIKVFGGTFMIHLLICVLFISQYRILVRKWPYNRLLIPMYVYGTALMFAFIDYGIVAGRIREMVCVPAAVVAIPSFILAFNGNARLVPFGGIIAYCLVWFVALIGQMEVYKTIVFELW